MHVCIGEHRHTHLGTIVVADFLQLYSEDEVSKFLNKV